MRSMRRPLRIPLRQHGFARAVFALAPPRIGGMRAELVEFGRDRIMHGGGQAAGELRAQHTVLAILIAEFGSALHEGHAGSL